MASSSDYPAAIVKRVARELRELDASPCEGIRVIVNEQNLMDVQAEITGPVGTPFEAGVFRLRLSLGQDFPNAPPKGFFLTKVFHPNVSTAGDVCISVLKKDWTSETTLRHVLMAIRCLLIEPFPESALNEEAGRLLLEDYETYAERARLMTSIHAAPAPNVSQQSGRSTAPGASHSHSHGVAAGPAGRGGSSGHSSHQTPLTTSGANASSSGEGGHHGGKQASADAAPGSPAGKKVKSVPQADHKSGQIAKVKKSLKRL